MKPLATLLVVMSLFVVPPVFLFAAPQDKKKQEEPTEESKAALKEAVAGLLASYREKNADDTRHFNKEVVAKFSGGDKALKKSAMAALNKGFKLKNKDLKRLSATSLAQTGGAAAKILIKQAKASKKDLSLAAHCIRSCGKLKNPKVVSDLVGYLQNKDNEIIAAAIVALGEYRETPNKIRQEIVSGLLKVYASVASAANKANPATSDKQKYEKLFRPFESNLRALTGNTETEGANVWARWYRKIGKKTKDW